MKVCGHTPGPALASDMDMTVINLEISWQLWSNWYSLGCLYFPAKNFC